MLQLFLKVILIMIALIALIIPGYILKKIRMINENAIGVLVAVLLYVCQPLLAINPFLGQDKPSLYVTGLLGWSFLFSFIGHIIIFFIAKIFFLKWKNKDQSSVCVFASVFTNCGFMGIPFVQMLTNDDTAVMFAVMYNVAFNVLIWTLGVYILTGDKKAISIKKAFINPSVIPLCVALPIYFFPQIDIISGTPIAEAFKMVANMSAPLSMMIVGIRLADLGFLKIFKGIGVYLGSLMRLIIAPAVLFAAALLLNKISYFSNSLFGLYAITIPVLLMGMSPASTLIAFSEKFNVAHNDATKIFLMGTLLSVFTVPFLVMAINWSGLL